MTITISFCIFHQVGLVTTGEWTPWCGGSIISTKHVLTAAHCTKDKFASSIEILIGEHNVGDTEADRRAISSITIHPNYDYNSKDYDVSLLTFVSPVTFTTAVGPICLPSIQSLVSLNPTNTFSDYVGELATTSGWGLTATGSQASETLQEVELTILANSECEEAYGSQIKR